MKSQSPLPMTHLLQQGHIFSIKATPPNPSLIAHKLEAEHVYIKVFWGSISFKLSQEQDSFGRFNQFRMIFQGQIRNHLTVLLRDHQWLPSNLHNEVPMCWHRSQGHSKVTSTFWSNLPFCFISQLASFTGWFCCCCLFVCFLF